MYFKSKFCRLFQRSQASQISISNKFDTKMTKLITLFGATGNQGGSVIRSLLADPFLSKEYKLRGITRDITKEAAKKLSSQGVEMVTVRFTSKRKSTVDMKLTQLGGHVLPIISPGCHQRLPYSFPGYQLLGDHEQEYRSRPGQSRG